MHRLLRIAGRIFQEDFPGLHGRHDLESVVSEVWMRLVVALESPFTARRSTASSGWSS